MKRLKELYEEFQDIIILILLVIVIILLCFILYKCVNKSQKSSTSLFDMLPKVSAKKIEENEKTAIKVDIKGAVKNPGVYEIDNNSNVADLINVAGGLTKKANTSNINLSRKLEDQMVVKVSTTSELEKKENNKVSECVCPEIEITKCEDNSIIKSSGDNINTNITSDNENNNTDTNSNQTNLVSINTATKEELMSVNGIGEAKALAIIEYRNQNGRFNTIEDIKIVTGIGDSLFEKIKSYITV